MTTKFINFTIEDRPWMINVGHVLYFKYNQGPGKFYNRLTYKLAGDVSERILFHSKTMEAFTQVYEDIMRFINSPTATMMTVRESDGEMDVFVKTESRRLEEL